MNLLITAVLILLLALVLQMGLLAFALYAVICVVLLSRYLTRVWIQSVHVEREIQREQVQVGETVAVLVTIRNDGRIPIAWLLIEDLLPRRALMFKPPDLQVHGRRMLLTLLRQGESKRLMYQLTCNRRGYFQIGPTVIESGDLFGLHRRYRIETEPHFLMVLPQVKPVEGYDVASRRPIGEVRMTHRLYEDPTRMAGVRRYEAGDPLNRVHWRATARTGLLHSKIYESSSVAGATILMDFHQATHPQQHEPVRSDLAVTAAASIANALYEMGQQVGVISNGRDAVDRIRVEGWSVPPRTRETSRQLATMRDRSERLQPVVVPTARGAATRIQIIEALARLELTDGLTFPQLILETVSRMPRDATVLAILPTVTEEIAIALGNLSSQGRAVAAIINTYEPAEFADCSGPLLAQGIATHHLRDEASIVAICRRLTLTGAR